MHIGLIVDEERLSLEGPMFERLCAGLLAAGDTLTLFVPEPLRPEDGRMQFAVPVCIEYPLHVPPWLQHSRTRTLADAIEKRVPDALYAAGADAWPVGVQLASAIVRPLALEIYSAQHIRSAPRRRASRDVAAYIVPTAGLGQALARRVDPALVSVVPMGVEAIEAELREPQAGGVSLAVIGAGRELPSSIALLTALSGIVRDLPGLQVVIELRGPSAHDVWREARRLELLGCMSAITAAEPLRRLVTRCDALLMPARGGELRSLTLEAMACGMAVLAAADPFMDMLVDGVTAALAAEPDAEGWMRLLRRVLMDPGEARRLGQGARALIRDRHQPAHQVDALRATLRRMVQGESIPFSTSC